MNILTVPNLISTFRLLLTPVLFFPPYRFYAIALSCLSDILDGFLARTLHQQSRFGAIIDPLADKVFVFTALALFFYEGSLSWLSLLALLSRDISLFVFSALLFFQRRWKNYQIRSFFCGKVATSLQFLTLALLSFEMALPLYLIYALFLSGALSFVELVWREKFFASASMG